jgi:type II secretory pathway pseudopilin PulG
MNLVAILSGCLRRGEAAAFASIRYALVTSLGLIMVTTVRVEAAAAPETFQNPDEAVTALAQAVNSTNREAFQRIFGPAYTNLVSFDRVEATNELREFSKAFNEAHHLRSDSDNEQALEVGKQNWPFPVPIVRTNGQWRFDTAAGVEELRNRRVGEHELKTLNSMRAYVAAQREYASRDRDGSGVLKYAQKLVSSPNKKDGLYWPPDQDGEVSPLGPLVAQAQGEGYRVGARGQNDKPEPFQGYYFKILTRQGKDAPGGKYDYVINGNMIGGFGLVAWPADYGDSGVMTFIVNQQGRIYQKDLGPKTESIVKGMKEYNPDKTWTVSRD